MDSAVLAWLRIPQDRRDQLAKRIGPFVNPPAVLTTAYAARLSGQLFSEVRAAERPCAKYQQ
jgi:hypothetical protein